MIDGQSDDGRSMKLSTVYILASARHGTLYIGVTSDLCSRIGAHKDGKISGITAKYGVKQFVWFGHFDTMQDEIRREKQLREWKRGWKIELIEKPNPLWCDLFDETCGPYNP